MGDVVLMVLIFAAFALALFLLDAYRTRRAEKRFMESP